MFVTATTGRAGLLPAGLLALGLTGCFQDPIDCADCDTDTPAPTPPVLELSADAIDFGQVELGETSQESLGVGNQGGSDLVLTGITATDPFVARYDADVTVAPSSSALLYVEVTPAEAGELDGTLSFSWNDPAAGEEGTTVEIPLTASVPADTGAP